MDRFWAKVKRGPESSCWPWRASTTGKTRPRPGGRRVPKPEYGNFKLNGTCITAHRAAWLFTNGSIPDGLFVCHRCDYSLCVNPAHLYLGTPADNSRDRSIQCRVGVERLTPSMVRRIRTEQRSLSAFADELGVSVTAVRNARSGRTWKWVE